MAKSRLHPQFFQTLVPSFNTHLTIPEDFFLKYIEGRIITELKSDSSDKTWKVNMSDDRRLTSGWEEFVVANDFKIGDVVVVRYEGDMVIHVSNLGPNYSEIQDISSPCNDNDGKSVLKKRLHSRTQVDFSSNNGDGDVDDEGKLEVNKNKKVKKSSSEAQEVASSSSSDNSCFVALVTATNLRTDTLYLPQHFTSSNGLTRNCRVIDLTDGGQRSWALDLRFNESSDTFYISRGWRNFCDENGQKEGGFFMFKLVRNGESLVFSFCPTDLINDRRPMDCSEGIKRKSLPTEICSDEEYIAEESSEDECSALESLMELEKKKNSLKRRSSPFASYSPCYKRFVTFTLPPDYVRMERLTLPSLFVKDNGINKPGEIYLLDNNGTKWLTSLLLDKKGTMALGKGWRDFVKANVLKTRFTLKLIWDDTTPVLSLCCDESTSDREQEELSKDVKKQSLFIDPRNSDRINIDEDNKENMSMEGEKNDLKGRDSIPSSQKQFVTLTITPSSFRKCALRLPKNFTRENDINKPGMTTLLGKDGRKHQTKLLMDKHRGDMTLGYGWKDFVKEYGLKTGDSFTLELTWQGASPVFSFCPAECNFDRGVGEGGSETNHKNSIPIEPSKDENIKEENSKEESRSMEREKNHLFGKSLLKKPLHSRTKVDFSSNNGDVDDDDDDDDDDNIEVHKNKKVKKSSSEAQVVFSSSSSDNSCFVALVTATSLQTDILDLPQHFTSSNGLSIKCCGIVLTDGGERSWALDLKFNELSYTFYISRGWRNFCDENGKKDGDFFKFKLIRNGEIPVFSFCATDFINDGRQMDCSEAIKRESLPIELCSDEDDIAGESSEGDCSALESEKKKNSLNRRSSPYSSYSPCYKQYVTFTLPPDYVRIKRLSLPSLFVKDNGINKPGEIYLLDKNGTKWLASLLLDKKGTMALGKGWKEFVKANVLETSFMLKLIWEDTTPVLSLCGAESTSDKEQEEILKAMEKPSVFVDPNNRDKINIDEDNKENMSMEREKNHLKGRYSIPSSQKQFLTLTITPSSVYKNRLRLPKKFTRENDINPGMTTLLGKDGRKQQANLLLDKYKGVVELGNGWKDFVKENGLKMGDSFTLELIWEDASPVFILCPEDSFLASQKQFVTLTITPNNVRNCVLRLSKIFTMENGINKPGMITLLGKNGRKHQTKLLLDKRTGTMALGNGWKDFVKENGLNTGDSFTLMLIWEDEIPVLSLCPAECSINRGTREGCSDTNQKNSIPIEPSKDENIKEDNSKEESKLMEREKNHLRGTDSIPLSQKQFVTLKTQAEFSSNDGDGDVDDEDNLEVHKNKKVKKSSAEAVSSSSSSDNSCFVSLVTATNLRTDTLGLPQHFTSSNGLTRKCHMIVLTDGGERSWALDLRFNESSDTFYISGGWRNFCDENGQKDGGFFMFKLVRNGEIPVLSFCPTYFINDRREMECSEAGKREYLPTELRSKEVNIAGKSSEDGCSALESLMELEKKKKSPKPRCSPYSSYSPSHKLFVTFTLPPDYVRIRRLTIPSLFVKDNGINKHGEIYLLDKNGTKWLTNLQLDKKGRMGLGKGWKDFVKANSLKTSFTVKLIWEGTTPVLALCGSESASDREQEEFAKDIKTEQEEFSKDIKKQSLFVDPSNIEKINKDEDNRENMSNHQKGRDSIPSSQKQFVTLTITPSSVDKNRLVIAKQFARDNSMEKPGVIYLLDTNGKKWVTQLQRDKKGTMSLGKEWKEFAEANDFKFGESFTMELVWEDETPMLSLFGTKTSSSKANEKAPVSSESESRVLTSVIENRFVTLALTLEDVKACKMILPSQFMKANGINKLGKITILGENKVEWSAYLLSRDGTVVLGNGWEGFCEANGVKLGESFTLEFICEQDTTPVLKLCSLETKIQKCSLGIEKL